MPLKASGPAAIRSYSRRADERTQLLPATRLVGSATDRDIRWALDRGQDVITHLSQGFPSDWVVSVERDAESIQGCEHGSLSKLSCTPHNGIQHHAAEHDDACQPEETETARGEHSDRDVPEKDQEKEDDVPPEGATIPPDLKLDAF